MTIIRGENSHPCLSLEGFGSNILALFDRWFQGIDEAQLRELIRLTCVSALPQHIRSDDALIDLFVLAFHVRSCRGGKGAKNVFYKGMKIMFEEFPVVITHLLALIPQYGYWKDLLLLVEEVKKSPVEGVDYSPLLQRVWEIFATQLSQDYECIQHCAITGEKPSISFAGKYAPREKKAFDRSLDAVSHISRLMFPDLCSPLSPPSLEEDYVVLASESDEITEDTQSPVGERPHLNRERRRRYRKVLSTLTAALDVPEVKMCSHRFADIIMSKIPSRCLALKGRAFANEKLKENLSAAELDTGNRHPDDQDRIACRRNLVHALTHNPEKIKGAQLYPHEFVAKVMQESESMTTVARLTLSAQWASLRDSVRAMVAARAATVADSKSDLPLLGNIIPLCDVSGSMSGTPMEVSIGLGVLLSELANDAFKDLILTFSSSAQWESLADCHDIVAKISKLRCAHWGMSTNFYNAMHRIALVVQENNLSQEEIPNLLVISDMQFDAAKGNGDSWNTAYENIVQLFAELGMRTKGSPFLPPTIIFWNVRGSVGFPVAADQPGVVMMSGYSPSLMKFILSGELEREEIIEEEEACGSGTVIVQKRRKVQVTPLEVLDKVLHEEAYIPVRELLKDLLATDKHVLAPKRPMMGELLGGRQQGLVLDHSPRDHTTSAYTERRPSAAASRHKNLRGKDLSWAEEYDDHCALKPRQGCNRKKVNTRAKSKQRRLDEKKKNVHSRGGQMKTCWEQSNISPNLIDYKIYY
jgi:hypothetical protein